MALLNVETGEVERMYKADLGDDLGWKRKGESRNAGNGTKNILKALTITVENEIWFGST